MPEYSFLCSLVGGGAAGFCTDVALFPVDTLKTRIQSSQGFWKSGGFNGVYRGLLSAAAGSAPASALFFATYETVKKLTPKNVEADSLILPAIHCGAASLGEVMACVVRVPTENIKQKLQAGIHKTNTECIKSIRSQNGLRGFYKGYWTTVLRDAPFSFLQFPLYEKFKCIWRAEIVNNRGYSSDQENEADIEVLQPWQGAICGSVSGAFAAALTTPLDVVKTRLMLGADVNGIAYTGMVDTFQRVIAEGGISSLYAGLGARVLWISIGGMVFFGSYEYSRFWWKTNLPDF